MASFVDFIEKRFALMFILLGLVIQGIVYGVNDDATWMSLLSGCCGIVAVVLCSQRKMISFLFSFAQLATYIYLAYMQRLWGEVGINVFYFILMLFTYISWKNNYDVDNEAVKTKKVTEPESHVRIFGMAMALTLVLFIVLKRTNDTQPWMDAVTTGPAIVAQILMMMRYREQWVYWFIIDVFSIIMWGIAGDVCMVVQYIFWTLNCIYGFILWSENEKLDEV